jgi:hypothetical protein
MRAARYGRVDESDRVCLGRVSWSASAAPTLLTCNQMVLFGQSSSSGPTTSRMTSAVGEHRDHDSGTAYHRAGIFGRLRATTFEGTNVLGFEVPGDHRDALVEKPMAMAEPMRPIPSSPTRSFSRCEYSVLIVLSFRLSAMS